MEITQQLQQLTIDAIGRAYPDVAAVTPDAIVVQPTRQELTGDFTIVTFALGKSLRDRPEAIAQKLGEALLAGSEEVVSFEVVKGFLNLTLGANFWRQRALEAAADPDFGRHPPTGVRSMVEFASPNTNKPLHLGHVRNILLGWSAARILEAAGHEVKRVQIVNDRGIAICKSMLAWRKFADGATPSSTGTKPDHFVGEYYVRFEREFQREYAAWQASARGKATLANSRTKNEEEPAKAFKNTYFNEYSAIGREARDMLLAWESGDAAVHALWSKLNGWVYAGFAETFGRIGVSFDKVYYESETYLLGKEMVERGLERGVFFRKEDDSVWVDLTDRKLDEKIVLRADGTSVYITQDLGTANQRFEDFGMDRMVYVVGDEQDYHFRVLFETLRKLGEPYAEQLYHLSYGMIDLTSGKMKSREGNVVDADDLMSEVVTEARAGGEERAELSELSEEERARSAEQVGMAAIKYFILRVGPKKRMTFDPKKSVELQGATGPYIQYSYVRANGVAQRAVKEGVDLDPAAAYARLEAEERDLIKHLLTLPAQVLAAAEALDPSLVADFAYNLAKGYHRFWHDHSVLSAATPEAIAFRVRLSQAVAIALRTSMDLLGIELPERM